VTSAFSYKYIYERWIVDKNKNRILIKNKYFFSFTNFWVIIKITNYLIRYKASEIIVNNIANTIVAFSNIFSGHLFVTSHIHQLISLRFKVTFLFCINITKIINTATITKPNFKNSNICLFFRK